MTRNSATPRENWFDVFPSNGVSRGERVLHSIALTNLATLSMGSYMAIVDVADLDSHDRADVYVAGGWILESSLSAANPLLRTKLFV